MFLLKKIRIIFSIMHSKLEAGLTCFFSTIHEFESSKTKQTRSIIFIELHYAALEN